MIPRFFFIFGRQPALSIGELVRILPNSQWLKLKQAALYRGGGVLDLTKLSQQLAGIVKLGTIIAVVNQSDFTKWLEQYPWLRLVKGSGKFHFGFSDYSEGSLADLTRAGIKVKKIYKNAGIASRFVTSRDKQLSSVVVAKNKLLTGGAELCFFTDQAMIYVGQTKAVQDFEYFGQKDYGRPTAQAKAGMLPPKLARMMIHLAEAKPTDSLLDPFCGVGTVLQEAADIGLTEVVGADIEEKAVEKAKENMAWFKREVKSQIITPQIIQSDIINLQRRLLRRTFDRIVTEGYLGPPLHQNVTIVKRRQIAEELAGFYKRVMPNLVSLLSPRGKIVIALPVIRLDKVWQRLDLAGAYERAGLRTAPIVPADWAEYLKHEGDSVIYSRPQQQVGREIVILTRK
ncbi:MAG: methyltransferase domain-containing protein [Patescibacteria group bacterium]